MITYKLVRNLDRPKDNRGESWFCTKCYERIEIRKGERDMNEKIQYT